MTTTAAPPPEAKPHGGFDYMAIIWRLISGTRRRWKVLVAWCLLVGCVSLYVAYKYTVRVWQARAVLLYVSLPMPEQQKDLYAPPDLKTLLPLFTSPANLDTICRENELPVKGKALEKNIEVTTPPGTRLMQLGMKWDEGEKARRMLDRAIELFMEQVTELRRRKVDQNIADYTASLNESTGRWEAAMRALEGFNREERVTAAVSEEQSRKSEALKSLDSSLTQARRGRSNLDKQMATLEEFIKASREQEREGGKEDRELEAAAETLADNRRRQDRLRELIGEERKVEEVKAQLVARQREMARLRPLVAKGLKKRAEQDILEAEIGSLVARINEGGRIKEWKEELERIDKVVVPRGAQKQRVSPIIQQTLFRKLELQLQMTAADEEISQLKEGVTRLQEDIGRLARLRQKGESLTKEVETADQNRQRTERQLAALQQLQKLGQGEFVVVTPALTGEYPISSNRTVLLIMLLGGGGIIGAVGAYVLECVREMHLPATFARSLPLPILEEVDSAADPLCSAPPVRSLALHIRQHAPDYGSVVLFGTAGSGRRVCALLDAAAACLARRDERVLLMDVRAGLRAAPPEAGLSDYLASDGVPDDFIQRTRLAGVDRLHSGTAPIGPDSLATHRMRDLLKTLRGRYSLVLIHGPQLAEVVDMTILAGSSQAILLVADEVPVEPMAARDALEVLQKIEAPLIGQVVLTAG